MLQRLHDRTPRRVSGVTLVELAVAIGLVAVLTTLALPMIDGWRDRTRVSQAQNDIIAMSMAIDAFGADNGRFPTSLAEVGRAQLLDPWQRPYVYRDLTQQGAGGHARKDHSLVPLNTDYDLYSSGPDGSSAPPLTAQSSRDDILRASNGRFIGPASQY
jgi:general secretion pathway protein G